MGETKQPWWSKVWKWIKGFFQKDRKEVDAHAEEGGNANATKTGEATGGDISVPNTGPNSMSPIFNGNIINAPVTFQYGQSQEHEKTILERRDDFMQQMARSYARLVQDVSTTPKSPQPKQEQQKTKNPSALDELAKQIFQSQVVANSCDFSPENLKKINEEKLKRLRIPFIESSYGFHEEMFPERKRKSPRASESLKILSEKGNEFFAA